MSIIMLGIFSEYKSETPLVRGVKSKMLSFKTGLMQDLLTGKENVNKLVKEAYGKI